MTRTEIAATFRIRLLDRHIRIAKANDDNLARRILDIHRALLPLARSVEWLVQCNVLSFVHVTFIGEGCFHVQRGRLGTASVSSKIARLSSGKLSRT